MNENFALNTLNKKEFQEINMVNKIITIIESHCIESKSSKRLFKLLQKCSNFLQALKMIDTFAMTEKIMVPNRFTFFSFSRKESMKDLSSDKRKPRGSVEYPSNMRMLSKRKRRLSPTKSIKERPDFIRSQEKSSSRLIRDSPENSPLKRIKSEDKMKKINEMKSS